MCSIPGGGESGPDCEGLKARSFTSFRMTKPGLFSVQDDKTRSFLRSGRQERGLSLRGDAIVLLRKTTNLSPAPLLCHSEERSDEESGFSVAESTPRSLPSGDAPSASLWMLRERDRPWNRPRDDRAHPTFVCCHSEGRSEKPVIPNERSEEGSRF